MTPVDLESLVEAARDVDGVLAGHRVGDEHDLVRRDGGANVRELLHELLVDVEPPRRVEETDVVPLVSRRDERLATDRHRILIRPRGMHGAAHLLAEEPELLDRRRATRRRPARGTGLRFFSSFR